MTTDWEKYLEIIYLIKDKYLECIKYSPKNATVQKKSPVRRWIKKNLMKRPFTKEDIQWQTHEKILNITREIRKMQMKTTRR